MDNIYCTIVQFTVVVLSHRVVTHFRASPGLPASYRSSNLLQCFPAHTVPPPQPLIVAHSEPRPPASPKPLQCPPSQPAVEPPDFHSAPNLQLCPTAPFRNLIPYKATKSTAESSDPFHIPHPPIVTSSPIQSDIQLHPASYRSLNLPQCFPAHIVPPNLSQ